MNRNPQILEILSDPEKLESFKQFLIKKQAVEGLFFLMELKEFKTVVNVQGQYLSASHICEEYIADDAVMQVNIEGKLQIEILALVKERKISRTTFDPVQDSVIDVLQSNYLYEFTRQSRSPTISPPSSGLSSPKMKKSPSDAKIDGKTDRFAQMKQLLKFSSAPLLDHHVNKPTQSAAPSQLSKSASLSLSPHNPFDGGGGGGGIGGGGSVSGMAPETRSAPTSPLALPKRPRANQATMKPLRLSDLNSSSSTEGEAALSSSWSAPSSLAGSPPLSPPCSPGWKSTKRSPKWESSSLPNGDGLSYFASASTSVPDVNMFTNSPQLRPPVGFCNDSTPTGSPHSPVPLSMHRYICPT